MRVLSVLQTLAYHVLAAEDVEVAIQNVEYGKYYSYGLEGAKDTTGNSYFLFKPKGYSEEKNDKLPVIVEFHGGGFTGGGPQTSITSEIQTACNSGIAYISVGYRLVATKYYYGDDQPEELIHVDHDGRLTLDTAGKAMDSYLVRRGRQEFMTKCAYDAAQMIEHLIAHADEFGVDVHRISTAGSSAGGGEIHYLTWVYHQWNVGRYTPVGMVYTNAQLDYPVQNMLDRVWSHWAEDVGESTKLSMILSRTDCGMIIGNPWCEQPADYNLCNRTYHEEVMNKFCGSNFADATLGEVRDALVWPADDPEVGKGMQVLWYNSLNMQKHRPESFHLYIANQLNGTGGMQVVHNALYGRNYAKYAEMAGINYTVYYTDYHGMREEDYGQARFLTSGTAWNYRSNHAWINVPGVKDTKRASANEQMLFHCFVLGTKCSLPHPTPSPGPLSDACKKAITDLCPHGGCERCIPQHVKALVAAGCPRHEGAGRMCIEFCKTHGLDLIV